MQPLVPTRLFINNTGGRDSEPQAGGGSVLETLLSLILSEKAGINISESSSKPLEEFIQKFRRDGGQGNRSAPKAESAAEDRKRD